MIFEINHGLVHLQLQFQVKEPVLKGSRVHFHIESIEGEESINDLTEGDIEFINKTEFFVEKVTNKVVCFGNSGTSVLVAELMVFGEKQPNIPICHVETIEELHSSVNEIDQWALIG